MCECDKERSGVGIDRNTKGPSVNLAMCVNGCVCVCFRYANQSFLNLKQSSGYKLLDNLVFKKRGPWMAINLATVRLIDRYARILYNLKSTTISLIISMPTVLYSKDFLITTLTITWLSNANVDLLKNKIFSGWIWIFTEYIKTLYYLYTKNILLLKFLNGSVA